MGAWMLNGDHRLWFWWWVICDFGRLGMSISDSGEAMGIYGKWIEIMALWWSTCWTTLKDSGTHTHIYIYVYTSSTRTRRGGSCLKDRYKTFLIYRTCMRRAPAKHVRACILRKWCPVSHVAFEAPLRSSRFTLHTPHSTLHTPHFTQPTAHSTLHTSHFTQHTSHFTVHTSHFTLRTSHFTLHTSHFTLHTSHFTLHTSHCTLHAPHFTLHPSHSTLHLIWALLTLSQLISSLLICHLSFHESRPSTTTKELACAVRQPGPCVRALCKAVAVLLSKNMTCARPGYNANTFLTLHIALFTPHTPHFTIALHLNSSHLSSFHLIPCLPICQLSSSWLFSCQVLSSTSTEVYY